jgi:hypothetical protein
MRQGHPLALTPGPSPRGRGEVTSNSGEHALSIVQDVVVPETKHPKAFCPHVRIAAAIGFPLIRITVSRAVTFYYKPRFMAVEVADVGSELVLPPKLGFA